MGLSKKVSLIIYRFKEKGLEVFLINDEKEADKWAIPNGQLSSSHPESLKEDDRYIELDPVKIESGQEEEALAVEGEWHDIPSLKGMLYEDAVKLKSVVKSMEKGTYFVFKEALKKVMPHQYEFLKELKDILTDRNSLKNL